MGWSSLSAWSFIFWIWSSGMPLLRHHHSGMKSPPTVLVFLWAQRFMTCCSTCFFRLSCPASAVFQKVSCSSAVSSLNSSIGQWPKIFERVVVLLLQPAHQKVG